MEPLNTLVEWLSPSTISEQLQCRARVYRMLIFAHFGHYLSHTACYSHKRHICHLEKYHCVDASSEFEVNITGFSCYVCMEEWHIIEISLSEFEVNITVFSMLCVYGGNIIVLYKL